MADNRNILQKVADSISGSLLNQNPQQQRFYGGISDGVRNEQLSMPKGKQAMQGAVAAAEPEPLQSFWKPGGETATSIDTSIKSDPEKRPNYLPLLALLAAGRIAAGSEGPTNVADFTSFAGGALGGAAEDTQAWRKREEDRKNLLEKNKVDLRTSAMAAKAKGASDTRDDSIWRYRNSVTDFQNSDNNLDIKKFQMSALPKFIKSFDLSPQDKELMRDDAHLRAMNSLSSRGGNFDNFPIETKQAFYEQYGKAGMDVVRMTKGGQQYRPKKGSKVNPTKTTKTSSGNEFKIVTRPGT